MVDRSRLPAPEQGLVLTHFLTVRDVARSRAFYADVLGGEVVLDENPAIVKVANTWIIMNPGGGPTPDKPDVTLTAPEPGDPVSAFMNVRVADIAAFYAAATARGAEFLTEPIDRKAEIRCYMRDPDGHLIEVGQATGMLEGRYAGPPATTG
ncbi:VOC family protein [Actinomadura soli]|uniref:VOC family protein n=1 Tax=Actinomadura soli TaxID=2508997 RepID=A0A5C4JHB8_9ACTN|nr:VOC family protein [Actinomadura soli]TMR03440.1 VOC family protein [Actinomadura soli]